MKTIDSNQFTAAPFVMTIDGRSVKGSAAFDVINPATETVLAQAPAATREDLDAAVAGANRAFLTWSRKSCEARREILYQMASVVEAHAEELGTLITLEQGKPLAAAIAECRVMGLRSLRGYAEMEVPVEVLKEDDTQLVQIVHRPIGVVGAIIPWNFPVHTTLQKIAPALYTGNTVVVKPSPYTPLSTLRMMEYLQEVMPPGVVQTLAGGDQLGVWIAEHPDIHKIAFTGSTDTGRKVMASAAETLKRLTLELGGNDAAIVLPDVDVQTIAPMIIRSAFNFTGQVCYALKRLYVHSSRYEPMCSALAEALSKLTMGDPLEPSTDLGPLTNQMQFDKVCRLVDEAKSKGGRILCGGAPLSRPGYFYAPTLVADVSEGMGLVDEEQFGPALPILKYESIEEAIERANGSDKGLSASVWTSDIGKGQEIASRLACGTAWVNQHAAQPTANGILYPFGGVKASGMGRERGQIGLLAYTQPQVVNVLKKFEM